MSSSFSIPSVTVLKELFTLLDTLGVPPIVGLEFTVKRDKQSEIGFTIKIRYLGAEQKPPSERLKRRINNRKGV